MRHRPRRRWFLARPAMLTIAIAAVVAGIGVAPPERTPSPAPAAAAPAGIETIDHVIIVVQENRSFDHYFGTYPGADGIPRTDGTWDVCLPDPVLDRCARPYHSTTFFDAGGAHNHSASVRDVNRGKMNGFVETVRRSGNTCKSHPNIRPCRLTERGPARQPDVMGFHTRAEIPNYWAYADQFVLQDRMFAPSDSWTLPAHLFLTSAWSADCSDLSDPMSCTSDLNDPGDGWRADSGDAAPYAWTDITYLLHEHGVSWAYYVGEKTCIRLPCPTGEGRHTTSTQLPIAGFRTVQQNRSARQHPAARRLLRVRRGGNAPVGVLDRPVHRSERASPGRHPAGPGLGDQDRQRRDAESAVGVERALPDVGRLGRLLRPRPSARRRRERVRDPRPRARDQPLGQARDRSPDPVVRRLPAVHRGSLPCRGATGPARPSAGPIPDRRSERRCRSSAIWRTSSTSPRRRSRR